MECQSAKCFDARSSLKERKILSVTFTDIFLIRKWPKWPFMRGTKNKISYENSVATDYNPQNGDKVQGWVGAVLSGNNHHNKAIEETSC